MNLTDIKKLRDETGASVTLCKTCLEKAEGDFEKARALLREYGVEIARKKSTRTTNEGMIGAYVHSNGKLATLVPIRCETDFVARTPEFQELGKDLAMHIAAMAPDYVRPEDIPEEVLQKERAIESAKLAKEGKPADMVEKILEGKIEKFYEHVTLLKQPFVKDDSKNIEQLLQEKIQKLGENIEIGEFVRLVL